MIGLLANFRLCRRSLIKGLQAIILHDIKFFMLISRFAGVRPPLLPQLESKSAVARKTALLVMPFYAKSRHGSLGKHVLTPALTLSSLAAATPPNWRVSIWDENLLQGPPR